MSPALFFSLFLTAGGRFRCCRRIREKRFCCFCVKNIFSAKNIWQTADDCIIIARAVSCGGHYLNDTAGVKVLFTGQNEKYIGRVQILIAALLWSGVGLVIRGVDCDIFWLLAIRSLAAVIMLAPSLRALQGRLRQRNIWLAAVFYAVFMLIFSVSTRFVGAAQTMAGQYTAPLFVYLLLVLRRRMQVRWDNLTPMLLIAIGCAVGLAGGEISALSLLPLLNGVFFPLYGTFLRQASEIPASSVMCIGNFFCVVFSVPLAIGSPLPSWGGFGLIVLTGLLVNGLAYTLYGSGAQRVDALSSVMLCLLEPILNPVWVWVFLGEAPSGTTLASLLLILAGGAANALLAAYGSCLESWWRQRRRR